MLSFSRRADVSTAAGSSNGANIEMIRLTCNLVGGVGGPFISGIGYSYLQTQAFASGFPSLCQFYSGAQSIQFLPNASGLTSNSNSGVIITSNGQLGVNTAAFNGVSTSIKLMANGWASFGSNFVSGDSAFNILDGTNGSTGVTLRFGNTLSTNNCMSMSWSTSASGAGSNSVSFNAYGTSNALAINCNNQVAVGAAATGLAGLYVASTVTQTIDAAGSGVSYFSRSTGTAITSTIGPITSVAVGIRCGGSVLCTGGFYTTSDVRVKKDIELADDSLGDAFMTLDPILYHYKTQGDDIPLQLGYSAQQALKNGCSSIVTFCSSEGLEAEDETIDIKDIQFSIDYSKVGPLLHIALKKALRRIDALESAVNELKGKQ